MLTSILAGVFIGAAILMLIFALKNKKSATCGDNCSCKDTPDLDGVEFGDDITVQTPRPKRKGRKKRKVIKNSNPNSEEV